jgi:hypothetical protein
MSSQGDNNYYILCYFILILPKGFKGVLTICQIQLSSYFSHRVFGGEILKMMAFKMIEFTRSSVVYKAILMDRQEDFQDYARRSPNIIQEIFKKRRCPRGSVRNRLA